MMVSSQNWYGQVMRKAAAIAASLLLLGSLAGCSQGAADPAPAEDATASESTEAAPLKAEEPAEELDSAEAAYLELIRQYANRDKLFSDASDADLIAAGKDACEQMAVGKSTDEVRVVDGEEPDGATGGYVLSGPIAVAARDNLC